MVRHRRSYTREFKVEALRLDHESEKSVAQIARELGIHPTILGRWIKQFDQDPEQAFHFMQKLIMKYTLFLC